MMTGQTSTGNVLGQYNVPSHGPCPTCGKCQCCAQPLPYIPAPQPVFPFTNGLNTGAHSY